MGAPYYNIPYFYDYQNVALGSFEPSITHVCDTSLYNYFQQYLIQKAMSRFEFKLPEKWNKTFFLYVIFCYGYGVVANTDRYGIIFQNCTLSGYDVYYAPMTALISNPLLKPMELRIDRDCSILKLMPNYGNIMNIVYYYANLLSLLSGGIEVNILNSRLAYVFSSGNKAAAESYKKMMDKIYAGDPAVAINKELFKNDGQPNWDTFSQNLSQNYITGDMLQDMRTIDAMFCTEIGLDNVNFEKKERLTNDEVNANNEEVQTKIELWLETLQESFEKCRKLFGFNDNELSVRLRRNENADAAIPSRTMDVRQNNLR